MLCIEFISIPGGCDAFEVCNVSSEEAESVELSSVLFIKKGEHTYGAPDHIPSLDIIPQVGLIEKHPFTWAGIRPLMVAVTFLLHCL